MKQISVFFTILAFYFGASAQTFNGSGGAVLNNGGQETPFQLSVNGLGTIDSLFGLEEVTVDITHPAVQELHIYLRSPSGIQVDLTGVLACKGANFSGTRFQSGQHQSVTLGTAPYTGLFRPVGNLGRVNASKPGNGTWTLFVKDFVAGANTGVLNSWSLKFGSSPSKPVHFKSSNLPVVFINSGNTRIGDDEVICDFSIIDNGSARNHVNDAKNHYNGKAAVNMRGSSSKMFEKNNYKVELRDNSGAMEIESALLGMPPESDWILTANYTDKTLLRNALTQHVFRGMGHPSPRYRFVELVLNGEYFGVYMLMEQIKRGRDRVPVAKITPMDNQFPYITGGYIIQINRSDDAGWNSLHPGVSGSNAKFYYQYNYPRAENITVQQQNYIRAFMDSVENVFNSSAAGDPVNGYRRYINDLTFMDMLIINELSKNVDAYRLSTFLYKHSVLDGGKLSAGPTWDYDLAWHNCNYGNTFSELYWQFDQPNNEYPIPKWWKTLMQDNSFKDNLYCRYHTLRRSVLSNDNLYRYIDETSAHLREARVRNFQQFPVIGTYIYPNPQDQNGATYEKEVQHLKTWIAKRADWLDKNIPGHCTTVGMPLADKTPSLSVFPNPFSTYLTCRLDLESACTLTAGLYDVLGNLVRSYSLPVQGAGGQELTLSTSGVPAGPYILKLSDGKRTHCKKIICTGD